MKDTPDDYERMMEAAELAAPKPCHYRTREAAVEQARADVQAALVGLIAEVTRINSMIKSYSCAWSDVSLLERLDGDIRTITGWTGTIKD